MDGTDIRLGGNKDFIFDGKKDDEVDKLMKKIKKNLGGLFIIETERHESRKLIN